LLDTTSEDAGLSAVEGVGTCQSACQTDADCAALGSELYSCETDIGDCTMAKVARTLAVGDPCTSAQETAGACFCITGSGTSGFCSETCTVGSTGECPTGWVCDSGEPAVLDFGPGSPTFPVLTKQTSGMLGICTPACSSAEAGAPPAEAGASASDAAAAAACPGTSTCVGLTIAGPDCQP
jgi:hypothetical protein